MSSGPTPAGPRTCWTSSTTGPTSSSRSPTASRCPCSTPSRQHADRWHGVRVHQMHVLHDRPYLHGTVRDHLLHVSYFLSHVTRPAFHARGCELVPNHFSEVPRLLRETTKCSLVLAAASPADRHGYFSLGTNCDYVAPFIGHAPFFLEVNHRMPRTFGANQLHAQPGRGAGGGRPAPRRAPRPRARPTSTAASPGRSPSGSPTDRPSRWASARSRPRCSRACATTVTSACTPRCSRTGSWTSSSRAWSPAPASACSRARR